MLKISKITIRAPVGADKLIYYAGFPLELLACKDSCRKILCSALVLLSLHSQYLFHVKSSAVHISKTVKFSKLQCIVHINMVHSLWCRIWVWLCIGCTSWSRFRSTSKVQWKLKPAASNEEEGGRKPNKGGDGDNDDVDVDVDGNDRCVDDDAKTGG